VWHTGILDWCCHSPPHLLLLQRAGGAVHTPHLRWLLALWRRLLLLLLLCCCLLWCC
jgi:hypothetical protein